MRIGLEFKIGDDFRYLRCSRAFVDEMEHKGEIIKVLRFINCDALVYSVSLDNLTSVRLDEGEG